MQPKYHLIRLPKPTVTTHPRDHKSLSSIEVNSDVAKINAYMNAKQIRDCSKSRKRTTALSILGKYQNMWV